MKSCSVTCLEPGVQGKVKPLFTSRMERPVLGKSSKEKKPQASVFLKNNTWSLSQGRGDVWPCFLLFRVW